MNKGKGTVSGSKLIFGYLGYVTVLVGFIILLPLAVLLFYPEEKDFTACFAIPGFAAIGIGYIMTFMVRGKRRGKLYKNQNLLIVLLIWLIAICIFAFPFFLMGKLTDFPVDFNYLQAFFEATSGITTSGFTMFSDVEIVPNVLLMYRSILLMFGGTGLILVMTIFLGKVYGMSLFNAEGHTDKIMPHVFRTAKVILGIYLSFIIGGAVLYVVFGMPLFDAINHAISAVSTGGFSTKNDSIGAYNSLPIEIVTMVLMFLGGTNFTAVLYLLKGKFKNFFTHSELKLRYAYCVLFIPLFTFFMKSVYGVGWGNSFRKSVFTVISTFTTTGLGTVDMPRIVAVLPAVMIPMLIMMFTGAGTGSTAGSVKEWRVALALKSIWWHVRDKVDDSHKIKAEHMNKFGENVSISPAEKSGNLVYLAMHLGIVAICTFVLTCCGYSFNDSLFESMSAFGTIGFSCGITSAAMPAPALVVQIIGMLVGRLEIYIILLGILRVFSDFKLWVRKVNVKKRHRY